MVRIYETKDENNGWLKVTELGFFQKKLNTVDTLIKSFIPFKTRPATLLQQESIVTSRSRNIYYIITVVQNNRDIMKITVQGELNIYFSFHGK